MPASRLLSVLTTPLSPLLDGATTGAHEVVGLGRQLTAQLSLLLPGPTPRSVWERPGRCYIQVYGLTGPGGMRISRVVERTLDAHPGVLWARVNAPSERVVVALGTPPPSTQELVEQVALAEARSSAPEEAEPDEWGEEPHHPSEGPGTRPALSALVADGVGLTVSTLSRVAPWTPLPSEVAGVIGALERHPRLRRLAERGLPGEGYAGSVIPVVSALVQGVATRGGGLVLDVVQRVAQWREASAERDAWAEAEPGLVPGPEEAGAEPIVVERPGPPPRDVAELYAERSMGVGALAGGVSLPFVGPRRSLAVALSSVPKAPEAGREGFATTLGRALSLRGTVVMERGALRRLGQVDTVVLEEAALRTDRWEPVDLAPLGGADPEGTAERLFSLFDPETPLAFQRDGDWMLGPLEDLELSGRTGRQAMARLRKQGCERFLGLALGRRLQAVAGLAAHSAPGADAVAAAARRAGARVVLATDRDQSPYRFADAVVPAGPRLVASVRELQADGAVVLLISNNRRALGASDCGIGVHQDGELPPWGAHLLVGSDLEAAGLVVDAIGVAARVDHDSTVLAAGGSGVGAVTALQSPPGRAAARSSNVVNASGSAAYCMGVWRARQLLRQPVDPPVSTTPWHLFPPQQVLRRLEVSIEGLSEEEAERRAETGRGPVEAMRTTLPTAFLEELANPLTPVLAAGAALAAAVGSRTDAALVAGIAGTSALVGSVQRVRTEKALAGLFARSAVGARVRRGGPERLVTAEDLVVGDVIVLLPEDVVPADCRLLEAAGVEVDESSLTGESLPVAKDPAPVVAAHVSDRRSMVYEGTTVSAGRAVAVVVAVGSATEVGRSMATARRSAPVTGVEARLTQLTRTGLPIALGSAAAVAGAALLHGHRLSETVASAVNLAVASVPEGLPFLVNAAQLAAARRLAEEGALVRNPRTIEALGRADVLCFDKTGTLTEGHLRLAAVSDGGKARAVEDLGGAEKSVLAAALRATPPARQSEPLAHQTDRAVVAGAKKARVTVRQDTRQWRRTHALPFDPSRSYHATVGRMAHGALLSVKGAPENVLARCGRRRTRGEEVPLDAEERRVLTAMAEDLAGAGRRVLAVAESTVPEDLQPSDAEIGDLTFLGFLTFADPVRRSAAPAAARLRKAGVQIVMLTGDHPATADAIASNVLDEGQLTVSTGPEIDQLDDEHLDALLPTVDVIARCSPHHKVRIVQAYQRIGRVVAMTGDGANDAPAIRLADVGIALGRRGTPAATAAADLVVSDDRLETVITALTEGRAMWASVRSALALLVGGNLGEITFSVLASALTGSAPLNARQIMLVNLLTDLAPALAIAVREPAAEAGERLLQEGPHQSLGAALNYEMVVRGATTALGAGVAWGLARMTGRRRRANTVALAAVVGTQLAQTLTTGGLDRQVLVAGLGSAAVLVGIVQTPVVSRFFGCTPLGPFAWGMALCGIVAATLLSGALSPLARRLAEEHDGNGDTRAASNDSGASAGGLPAAEA